MKNTKNKIICIGNRLIPEDAAAMAVYDLLTTKYNLSKYSLSGNKDSSNSDCAADSYCTGNIEIIEGGIAGLNLLGHLENAGNVVFVDTVSGFAPSENFDRYSKSKQNLYRSERELARSGEGSIVVLNQKEIKECLHIDDLHYGHDTGIAYLLSVLPMVCDGHLPKTLFLVGLQGECSHDIIDNAATISLEIGFSGFF